MSHLTPKFIEGCDLCESYGETSYVCPQNTCSFADTLMYFLVNHTKIKCFLVFLVLKIFLYAGLIRFPFLLKSSYMLDMQICSVCIGWFSRVCSDLSGDNFLNSL